MVTLAIAGLCLTKCGMLAEDLYIFNFITKQYFPGGLWYFKLPQLLPEDIEHNPYTAWTCWHLYMDLNMRSIPMPHGH